MSHTRRIASLISSATEILYLLGLGDQVVGVSHECDYPPEIAAKPRLTRSLVDAAASSRAIDHQVRELASQQSALYTVDGELLDELAPDLIITQAQCDVCAVRYDDVVAAVRRSQRIRDAEVVALSPSRLSDVFDDIRRIGEVAGVGERAAQVIGRLESRVARVREATAQVDAGQRPRVALLEWIDPPMLAANWTPELVAWAGGNDGLDSLGRHSSYADWEQIAAFDPEVIVIMPCGFDLERAIAEAQTLPGVPQWGALSAVRTERVFAADGNAYFNRSGPRLVESLEILAHLFHPDRFAPPALPGASAWRRLRTEENQLLAVKP